MGRRLRRLKRNSSRGGGEKGLKGVKHESLVRGTKKQGEKKGHSSLSRWVWGKRTKRHTFGGKDTIEGEEVEGEKFPKKNRRKKDRGRNSFGKRIS